MFRTEEIEEVMREAERLPATAFARKYDSTGKARGWLPANLFMSRRFPYVSARSIARREYLKPPSLHDVSTEDLLASILSDIRPKLQRRVEQLRIFDEARREARKRLRHPP